MSPSVPVIPDSAPFTPEQRAWLNGFFAGIFSRTTAANTLPGTGREAVPTAAPLVPLTILFGSQTGTAEGLAKRAAKEAGRRGFAATVLDLAAMDIARLAAEKNVLLITSTYGDGEPPDGARALHQALAAAVKDGPPAPPPLSALRFSVCALGDTNYTQFCKCGADFDSYLERLGATRSSTRVDCDLEYEEKFTRWLSAALATLAAPQDASSPSLTSPTLSVVEPAPAAPSRSQPFPALLRCSRNLSGAGSAKQIHHVEFDVTGSSLNYEAGDALGVRPHNCPQLVAEILGVLGCDGEEAVPAPDGSATSLRRALAELYDLGKPSPELLARSSPEAGGGTAVAQTHVIDVLLARAIPTIAPADFVRTLRKLQPRLYSISSSPKAHPHQVHLTVGAVRYDLHGRARRGVCSTFLADRAVPGETRVGVFVHPNKSFRPPAAGDTPMIMVGPGTGLAPFRAFLQERRATGARGRNWLFFGDQREETDFIYRDEILAFRTSGLLSRLDLAWSRDQAEKIYVQQRLRENASELFAWLEAGAHFYVCGDAARMARDVDAALHQVIVHGGGRTPAQAADYVQALAQAKRYVRDVY